MLKIKNVFFVLLLLTISLNCLAEDVVLKAGTAVPVKLESTISSKNAAVGQIVNFRVTAPIMVDGKTVIESGAIVTGQVVRAKKNGILGKEGELQLTINSVLAVDGTKVMLSSANLSDEGNNNLILSLFLCFLIKGGSAEIPAGMECTSIVAGATTITL